MPKVFYRDKNFGPDALAAIRAANQILDAYAAQGFVLTLRQLYYQFVARGYIPNTDRSYKRLGAIVSDARMAGLIDWDAIEDRTRNLRPPLTFASVEDRIEQAARNFKLDLWEDQPNYVEVWVEKDALVGVVERAAVPLRVPYFSCRGYTSQSEMWGASQRLWAKLVEGKSVVILHFGDHDPSGKDMTRDIIDRLAWFITVDETRRALHADGIDEPTQQQASAAWDVGEALVENFVVLRMALNWNQIQEYEPPPNPAKVTDSRAKAYIAEFGRDSWELDALEPQVIADLITDRVEDLIDHDRWNVAMAAESAARGQILTAARRWNDVQEALRAGA